MRLAAISTLGFMKTESPSAGKRPPQLINPSNPPRPSSSSPAKPLAPARKFLPLAGTVPDAVATAPGHPAEPARHHLRARAHRRPHRGHRHPRRQDQDALEGDPVPRRRERRRRRGTLHFIVGSEGAAEEASQEDDNVSSHSAFSKYKSLALTHSPSPFVKVRRGGRIGGGRFLGGQHFVAVEEFSGEIQAPIVAVGVLLPRRQEEGRGGGQGG